MRKFTEQFTLGDLDNHAVSSLTAEYLFDREHGSGQNVVKLQGVKLSGDKLYIHYRAQPTYTTEVTTFNTDSRPSSGTFYDVLFEFQSAADELGDVNTLRQFSSNEQLDLVRSFIENGLARTWCSCPAFAYQGHWEAMSSHGSSVFPWKGPRGKGIWKAKHTPGLTQPGISICKHIAAVIHQLDNDIPLIVRALIG